jgi:hypothetical protein
MTEYQYGRYLKKILLKVPTACSCQVSASHVRRKECASTHE